MQKTVVHVILDRNKRQTGRMKGNTVPGTLLTVGQWSNMVAAEWFDTQ